MDREILFRGKRVDGEGWIKGFLVKTNLLYYYIIPLDNDGPLDFFEECYKVIPESVGQYIGLKTNNGREIFEGDILFIIYNFNRLISEVVWGGVDYPAFHLQPDLNEEMNCFSAINFSNEYKTRVIGNVHDNPDLLADK